MTENGPKNRKIDKNDLKTAFMGLKRAQTASKPDEFIFPVDLGLKGLWKESRLNRMLVCLNPFPFSSSLLLRFYRVLKCTPLARQKSALDKVEFGGLGFALLGASANG